MELIFPLSSFVCLINETTQSRQKKQVLHLLSLSLSFSYFSLHLMLLLWAIYRSCEKTSKALKCRCRPPCNVANVLPKRPAGLALKGSKAFRGGVRAEMRADKSAPKSAVRPQSRLNLCQCPLLFFRPITHTKRRPITVRLNRLRLINWSRNRWWKNWWRYTQNTAETNGVVFG